MKAQGSLSGELFVQFLLALQNFPEIPCCLQLLPESPQNCCPNVDFLPSVKEIREILHTLRAKMSSAHQRGDSPSDQESLHWLPNLTCTLPRLRPYVLHSTLVFQAQLCSKFFLIAFMHAFMWSFIYSFRHCSSIRDMVVKKSVMISDLVKLIFWLGRQAWMKL